MRTGLILIAVILFSTNVVADELAICARIKVQPKHYLGEDGKPGGYALEIAQEAVERSGYSAVIKNYPWMRAQETSVKGGCIITAFSKTTEREKHYLYSVPMFEDRVLLWQAKDRAFEFNELEDLIGKKIAIRAGSQYSGEFEHVRSKLNLVELKFVNQGLKMLINGRLDGAIFPGDSATVKYIADTQGLDFNKLQAAQKPISLDPNHLGVPKALIGHDPQDVVVKLSQALKDMAHDGTTQRILNKYR